MKCPKCNENIISVSQKCIKCGYVFEKNIYDKLSLFFDLKTDLDDLISIKDRFNTGVDKFASKIKKYEELINRDIANIESMPSVTTDQTYPQTGQAEASAVETKDSSDTLEQFTPKLEKYNSYVSEIQHQYFKGILSDEDALLLINAKSSVTTIQ